MLVCVVLAKLVLAKLLVANSEGILVLAVFSCLISAVEVFKFFLRLEVFGTNLSLFFTMVVINF